MDARHLIGFVLTAVALGVPANAHAVTCDGPTGVSEAGLVEVVGGCDDASVAQIAGALGTDTSNLDRLGAPVEIPSGRVVRLQQSADGVPVLNGQVVLSYDRAGNLDMVQSSAIPDPDIATNPAISAADAIGTAGFGGGKPKLVVYPNSGTPILAWHVERATMTSDLNAIVDAQTGALVRSWNAIQEADAPALAFDPNPVQTSGDTTLVDGPLGNDTGADAYRQSVTLTNLNSGSVGDGDYASVLAPPSVSPGNYSRADLQSRFEAVNTYYAITEAQKKIQALGFTDVNNRSIGLTVNLDPQDNSNYNSATKQLTFGAGGVDDAEDSEVVLHEYGHSIQDNQVPGFGSGDEQGAMGEGFGDFFAGMFYLDKGSSGYQATRRYCIAEWDATSYNPVDPSNGGSGCLRWINGTDETDGADIGKYSNEPTEVHDDGRFWSAGMTCIFEGLSGNLAARRDQVLKLVIDSQQSLVPIDDNTAFEAQIASMVTSDQNLYGGADVGLIRNCADVRGLATLAETDPARDKTPPEVTAKLDPAAPDGADGFYTGNVKVTWTVVDKESTATTNGCGPVTIDSNTGDSGVTLTCTATSQGGMTSKTVTIKRRGAPGSDDKAPKTTIGKHPRKRTRRGHARFQFKANEDSSFECSLDGGRFSKCKSPVKVKVKPGDHTFDVRATDAAGNVEKDPASFSWTVKARKRHHHG